MSTRRHSRRTPKHASPFADWLPVCCTNSISQIFDNVGCPNFRQIFDQLKQRWPVQVPPMEMSHHSEQWEKCQTSYSTITEPCTRRSCLCYSGSISNFSCSLTRNITLHSMKKLAFHSLLRRTMIILPILTISMRTFLFKLLCIDTYRFYSRFESHHAILRRFSGAQEVLHKHILARHAFRAGRKSSSMLGCNLNAN